MVGSGVAKNKPQNNKETTNKASRALRVFTFTLPSHFSANQQPRFLKWEAREREREEARAAETRHHPGRPFQTRAGRPAGDSRPGRGRDGLVWARLTGALSSPHPSARSWELEEGTQDSSMGSKDPWGQSDSTAGLGICLALGPPGTLKRESVHFCLQTIHWKSTIMYESPQKKKVHPLQL